MDNYGEAFSEVIEVINNSSKSVKEKIPDGFVQFLQQNKDENYIVNINFNDDKWEETVKKETRTILALIYRDYLVSEEERKKLIIEEQKEKAKYEEEQREKYNPDNIFKEQNQEKTIIKNETSLVEYKESIFKKIINKIKSIFYKK